MLARRSVYARMIIATVIIDIRARFIRTGDDRYSGELHESLRSWQQPGTIRTKVGDTPVLIRVDSDVTSTFASQDSFAVNGILVWLKVGV